MTLPFSLRRSIRGRLFLITAAVVVPAAILAGLVMLIAHQQGRVAVEAKLRETSRALSLVVHRQLGQTETMLRTLTLSPALAAGDYQGFAIRAGALMEGDPGWITALRADGQELFNTLAGGTEPLRRVPLHDGVAETLAAGESYVSNLFVTVANGAPAVAVALPYRDPASEIMALVQVLPVEAFNDILADQRVPPTWNASIVDRDGYVLARSRSPELVGRRANEHARGIILQAESGVYANRVLDGVDSLVGFSRVPGADWTVALSAPRAELLAPTYRLMLVLAAGLLALLAAGVATALWSGRGVVRAMDSLVVRAQALGHGEPVVARPLGLDEADTVAAALHTAARERCVREQELLRLNQTLETRVQEASERLVAASKREIVGRITGGVAHDFNNLLAAVRINLELAARYFPEPRARRAIDTAHASTERGARLVGQLLAFSRQQRLAPEPVDVNALVENLASMLRSSLGGAIEVRLQLAPGLEHAQADPTQLELMIMNLAINARDAMVDGGRLSIETAQVEVGEGDVAEAPPPGRYIAIKVSDNGTGMPPEVLAQVFEPFFTTKEAGAGSGLGLPQVLGVVKQLGGGLRLTSAPGQGTTVELLLPPATAAAQQPAAVAARPTRQPVHGLRVLLVDDDDAVRAATAEWLAAEGGEVAAFASGGAALQELAAGLAVDVALVDYAMPEMSGLELARRLAIERPQLPVVLATGYADAAALTETWEGRLLQKPYAPEQLTALLSGLARGAG